MGRGISPTSSRKRVPPFAASKSPGRSAVAPVKAPRECPKSSLSRRDSLTAPQFTPMNGPSAHAELSCTKRAMRSFPVPLSPVMSTVESTLAIVRAMSTTRRISGLRATMPEGSSSMLATRASRRVRSRSRRSVLLSASATSFSAASIPSRLKKDS